MTTPPSPISPPPSPSTDLVRVPFYGDNVDCIEDHRGVWISIPTLCENLGVDAQGQTRKLREKAWGVVEMISTTDSRGLTRPTWCMHIKSLPMWLATIDASRVAERIRPKLVAYQKECAEVLHAHFLKPAPITPAGISSDMLVSAVVAATISAVQQAVPVIVQAVAATIREDREEEKRRQDVIGHWGAGLIRRSVKEAALLKANSDDKKHIDCLRQGFHQDLRRELHWGGTGRPWARFPMSRMPALKDALNGLLMRVKRESPSPQLDLIPAEKQQIPADKPN
jgi:hypothetical protein